MSERASWFRCDPSRLLGALAGMEPDSGYIYTVILMRIYEVGGPISDDEVVLSRRTGLSAKRVSAALSWLIGHGKIDRQDGVIDSDTTHDELAFREKSVIDARNAGKESAKRKQKFRHEKHKQKQQNEPTTVERPLNGTETSAQRPSTEIELEVDIEVARATSTNARARSDSFSRFWTAWPHKVGKPDAARAFLKVDDEIDSILVGIERYIANKPPDRPWLNPSTFLNQRRWEDVPATVEIASNYGQSRNGKGSLVDAGLDLIRRLDDAERRDAPQAGGWPRHEDVVLLPGVRGYRP